MSGTATAEPKLDTYPRDLVERIVACRMLGGLFGLLSVLALLAPSKATVYQLVAFVPAAAWLLWQGSERLPASVEDEPSRPTHPAILGAYAIAAVVAAALAFGTWHATSEIDFSGFDRGAGWFTLSFGVILGLSAASLRQPNLMRPFDTALHVVALVCATVFIGAAISGTYSAGLSTLRLAVLATGVVVFTIASRTLTKRATDTASRRGVAAAIFSAAGALMAASSRMSWGGGGFLVNYRPGSSMGGFDGRVSLWAGVAIAGTWIGLFLWDKADEAHWVNAARGTAALGFLGLVAVVNSARGASHPGRVLAAASCIFVLSKLLGMAKLSEHAPQTAGDPTFASTLVGRFFAGTVALIGAVLFMVGSTKSSVFAFFRMGRSIEYDEVMAMVTFGGLGLVLLRAAMGSVSRRAEAAGLGGIVLGGLALVAIIPPAGVSTTLLVSAVILAGLAALGLSADKWIGPPTERRLTTKIFTTARNRWRHLLAVFVITFVAARWVIPEVLPRPSSDPDYTEAEVLAYRERVQWFFAVKAATLLSLVALMTTGRDHLARAVGCTALSGTIFFLTQQAINDVSFAASREYGVIVQSSLGVLAVVFFALGRGRYSVTAIAGVAALCGPWLISSLTFLLPRSTYDVAGLRTFLHMLPETGHYTAIALVFLAFPIGGAARPQAEPPSPEPSDPAPEALLGSADGTER